MFAGLFYLEKPSTFKFGDATKILACTARLYTSSPKKYIDCFAIIDQGFKGFVMISDVHCKKLGLNMLAGYEVEAIGKKIKALKGRNDEYLNILLPLRNPGEKTDFYGRVFHLSAENLMVASQDEILLEPQLQKNALLIGLEFLNHFGFSAAFNVLINFRRNLPFL